MTIEIPKNVEAIEVVGLKEWIDEHDKQIRADAIEEILKNIELGIDATGHSDQYTTGFCNALIWLKSCITHEEPQFLEQLKEQK